MSKIALEGNASGTGTFTIASPNSNSNYTLTLPSSTGTVVVTGGAQTIEFAAGSAASPSITFTGDTNTGIFSPGADTIAFAEGGAEAMRIDSSGNVSIGATSSSSQAFRVSQTAFPNVPSGWYANAGDGNAEQYGITRVDATNGRGIRFQTTLDGSNLPYYSISTGTAASTIAGMTWTERMRITSAGNVGIGVSAPATILHASGSIITQGTGGNTAPTGQTVAGMYSNSAAIFISGFGTSTPNTYQPIIFQQENQVGSAERMRIDSSGNVGIGTTSVTSSRVQIKGANNTTTAYADGLKVTSNNETVICNYSWAGIDANDSLRLATAGTERARITSAGEFIVGKTSTATGVGAYIDGLGNINTQKSSSANTSTTMEVYSTGASAFRFYVGMGGTIYATSTTITAISDQRLKENIQDIDVGLDAVMSLKPRKFDWKEGKGKDKKGDRGWIAQEFEQVFPDMIDTWKDEPPEGEEPYKSVNADLIPVLVKAIQDLKAITDAQATRIEALEAEVAALKGQ